MGQVSICKPVFTTPILKLSNIYSFNTLELIWIWIDKKHNVSNNSKLLNKIFYIVLQHDHWDKQSLTFLIVVNYKW